MPWTPLAVVAKLIQDRFKPGRCSGSRRQQQAVARAIDRKSEQDDFDVSPNAGARRANASEARQRGAGEAVSWRIVPSLRIDEAAALNARTVSGEVFVPQASQ